MIRPASGTPWRRLALGALALIGVVVVMTLVALAAATVPPESDPVPLPTVRPSPVGTGADGMSGLP